jgi:1-acyl-sn-glycerol-3-phosphate acyltransferase
MKNRFYTFLYAISWPIFRLLLPAKERGREHIPEGAVLVCGNHSSYADPFLLAHAFRSRIQVHFMAKIELRRIPVVGWYLQQMGTFFVNRGASDSSAIKKAIRYLRSGEKVMMFPEGTRVHPEEKAAGKTGAAMLAVRTGVPILPVYIATRKRLFCPNPVIIGKPYTPILPEGVSGPEGYQIVVKELMEKIKALEEQAK